MSEYFLHEIDGVQQPAAKVILLSGRPIVKTVAWV